MEAQGTVYDLGYTPHEGERLGRQGAFRAMLVDGVRRALGLRRKPWTKVLPWGLAAAAIVPAGFAVALTFLVSGFTVEEMGEFGDPAEFFDNIGMLSLFFVALITPVLLIPDRKYGVLSIYASRPVRAADYLLARVLTILALTTLFILIPHTVLYVGISSLNVNGIWAGLVENGAQIPEILGTTAAYVLGYGAPAILVSLFIDRVPVASGVFVIAVFMTAGLAEAIPRVSELFIFKVLAPLAVAFNPLTVRDWLFEVENASNPLDRVGLPQWVAALSILGIAIVTAVVAYRRYRKQL